MESTEERLTSLSDSWHSLYDGIDGDGDGEITAGDFFLSIMGWGTSSVTFADIIEMLSPVPLEQLCGFSTKDMRADLDDI